MIFWKTPLYIDIHCETLWTFVFENSQCRKKLTVFLVEYYILNQSKRRSDYIMDRLFNHEFHVLNESPNSPRECIWTYRLFRSSRQDWVTQIERSNLSWLGKIPALLSLSHVGRQQLPGPKSSQSETCHAASLRWTVPASNTGWDTSTYVAKAAQPMAFCPGRETEKSILFSSVWANKCWRHEGWPFGNWHRERSAKDAGEQDASSVWSYHRPGPFLIRRQVLRQGPSPTVGQMDPVCLLMQMPFWLLTLRYGPAHHKSGMKPYPGQTSR